MLDGKQISDTNREFLKRLEINKAGHKLAPDQTHINSTLSADIMSEFLVYFICETLIPCIKQFIFYHCPLFSGLTKNFTPGVISSVTRSIVQDAEFKEPSSDYTTKLSKSFMFPAWKAWKI